MQWIQKRCYVTVTPTCTPHTYTHTTTPINMCPQIHICMKQTFKTHQQYTWDQCCMWMRYFWIATASHHKQNINISDYSPGILTANMILLLSTWDKNKVIPRISEVYNWEIRGHRCWQTFSKKHKVVMKEAWVGIEATHLRCTCLNHFWVAVAHCNIFKSSHWQYISIESENHTVVKILQLNMC